MGSFELGIVLLSAFIHAIWSVSIKHSRAPLAFNLLQAAPLALLCLPTATLVDLTTLPTSFWWLLAATGVAHALYFYWLSLAFERADLSLAYPIARSTPVFLPLFAWLLLGEQISSLGLLGIATVVAGMWTVQLGAYMKRSRGTVEQGVDGTSGTEAPAENGATGIGAGTPLERVAGRGMGYAYLTLAATVAYGLTDKALMTELAAIPWTAPVPRALFGLFAMWLACTVLFAPLALWHLEAGVFRAVVREEWPRATGAAVISIAGYGLILRALETAPASYVVAVRQASVLFVLGMSVFFLRERPGVLGTVGAVATVVGVALIAGVKT